MIGRGHGDRSTLAGRNANRVEQSPDIVFSVFSARKTIEEAKSHFWITSSAECLRLREFRADHDINAYISLLRRDGNITLVGAPNKPLPVSAFGPIRGRRSLPGSPIGGMPETQAMLDFCRQHNITADVEVIPIPKVNEACERLLKSDVRYRFPIDTASLKSE